MQLSYHFLHQTSVHGQCQSRTMQSWPCWTDRNYVLTSCLLSTFSAHGRGMQHLLSPCLHQIPSLAGSHAQKRYACLSGSQSTKQEAFHRILSLQTKFRQTDRERENVSMNKITNFHLSILMSPSSLLVITSFCKVRILVFYLWQQEFCAYFALLLLKIMLSLILTRFGLKKSILKIAYSYNILVAQNIMK